MAFDPEAGRSKIFAVFEKNIARVSLILRTPESQGQEVSEKLSGYANKILVLSDATPLGPFLAEVTDSITLKITVLTWAIPMVVTFTEVYLQDAFTLMVKSAFGPSALPGPMVEEVTGKWIKDTMRSGNPHQWINHLNKFGATGYPEDLGTKLQKIWGLRHQIIHSADPHAYPLKDFSVADAMRVIALFVRSTDEFLIHQCPDCLNVPTTQHLSDPLKARAPV